MSMIMAHNGPMPEGALGKHVHSAVEGRRWRGRLRREGCGRGGRGMRERKEERRSGRGNREGVRGGGQGEERENGGGREGRTKGLGGSGREEWEEEEEEQETNGGKRIKKKGRCSVGKGEGRVDESKTGRDTETWRRLNGVAKERWRRRCRVLDVPSPRPRLPRPRSPRSALSAVARQHMGREGAPLPSTTLHQIYCNEK